MAVPTFVAASSASTNSASANITCNYPAGSSSGDLLVLSVGFQRSPTSGTQSISTPSGWTQLQHDYMGVGQVAALYWRFRGAETSVTVTCSNASSEYGTAMIHAYTGDVDPTTPINASSYTTYTGTSTTSPRTLPALTTTFNNCALSFFFHADKATSGTTVWSGATEETDNYSGTSGRLLHSSATGTQATAGAITQPTWVPSSNNTNESQNFSVAISPMQQLDVPVTDSVASAETQQVVANVPATDGISTASETATISMPGTDGITRSETAQVIANTPAADATQSAETQQVIANVPATDSTSVSESAYVINVASASDSAQTAESASVTVNVTDTATFTETQAGIGQETASFGENQAITVTVSDGISTTEEAYSATAAQGDDGVGSTEQASVGISVSDSINGAVLLDENGFPITETGVPIPGPMEQAMVIANVPATDGVSVGENQRLIIHVTDSMSSTETAVVRITVADSVSSVDSASVIVTVFATDGMSAAETTIEGVSDSDSATFTESAFRLISGLLVFPRQVKIMKDDRRVIIEAEPRRVSIDPDYRRTSIRAEVRRHIVIPKDKRVFEIEGE